MTFVEACRAFKAVTGKLPLDITMMIEGEEECGSKHLFGFVRDNAAELKRDLALVCDTGMWDAADAVDHHLAARACLRGSEAHLRRPRSAFRACSAARRAIRSMCSRDILVRACTAGRLRSPFRASMTAFASCRPTSKPILQGPRFDAGKIPRPDRIENPGGRKRPHGDRADLDAADRRGQRHHRRLYRRRGEDRHPGQGDGQGLVPPGRGAGPGKDPRRFPRFRSRRALPADCTVEFGNHTSAPAFDVAFDNPALSQGAHGAGGRVGQEGR